MLGTPLRGRRAKFERSTLRILGAPSLFSSLLFSSLDFSSLCLLFLRYEPSRPVTIEIDITVDLDVSTVTAESTQLLILEIHCRK